MRTISTILLIVKLVFTPVFAGDSGNNFLVAKPELHTEDDLLGALDMLKSELNPSVLAESLQNIETFKEAINWWPYTMPYKDA